MAKQQTLSIDHFDFDLFDLELYFAANR